jgi:hypothetical protein
MLHNSNDIVNSVFFTKIQDSVLNVFDDFFLKQTIDNDC